MTFAPAAARVLYDAATGIFRHGDASAYGAPKPMKMPAKRPEAGTIGHKSDGIQELSAPPCWWLWTLDAMIIWRWGQPKS